MIFYSCFQGISIHALREEGDLAGGSRVGCHIKFLSTPSARRATSVTAWLLLLAINFYPRPPRGGRRIRPDAAAAGGAFLSTPSARRATSNDCSSASRQGSFLSTPSARRATCAKAHGADGEGISIHALREEGDTARATGAPLF